MIIFYLLNVILCQTQIFPLQSQMYYSPLEQLSRSFKGYDVQIIGESLGFNIQQTIVQGIPQTFSISNIIIDTNGTISTCLTENTIGLLTQESDNFTANFYLIQTDGTITNQNFTYQQNNSLQSCQTLAFVNNAALMHCINNSNNQVILYQINSTYNNTIYSPIFINSTFVQSVQIQQYNFALGSDIYFIYNLNYSTIIYRCVYDGAFNDFSQYFKQDSIFMQIMINFDGSIFALQQDTLLFYLDGEEEYYHDQTNQSFTSFNVKVIETHLIYLVYLSLQYEIQVLYFNRRSFYLQDLYLYQQLTYNSQIYLDFNYILVVLDEEIIYFKQSTYLIQLIGFSKVDAFNQFNLYSRLSDLLVTFNQQGFQLYQIGKSFIYCYSPQQSGLLTLDLYSYTNLYSGTIYVNVTVISDYVGQIIQVYDDNGLTFYRFGYKYFQQTLFHYYLGPNISYSLSQGSYGSTNFIYANVQIDALNYLNAYIHNLNEFSSYLQVAQTSNNDLIFSMWRYGFQVGSSFILWKYTITNFIQSISGVSFYDNYGMVSVVILTSKQFFVFDVEPLISVYQTVNFDMATYLGETSLSFISSYQFDQQLFILYTNYLVRISIQEMNINIVMQIQNDDFKYMSGNGFNLYIVEKQSINVYFIEIINIELIQSYQLTSQSDLIYVLPIYEGIFVIYGSSSTWNIMFLDYSAIQQVNIGQNFTTTLNTVGYDFHKQIFASSEYFFYAIVTQNSLTYLNVYRNPQEPINSLYLSIYLSITEILGLSATTCYITSVDYISVMGTQNYQNIYMIYHYPKLGIFFDFYPLLQYNLTNTFQISNNVSNFSQIVTIDVNQEYLQIIGIQNQTIYNQTSQQLIINPLEIFSGVVQNYTVSYYNCSSVQYFSVFSPDYVTINGSNNFVTMSVVGDTQNIYLGNVAEITQYQFNATQLQAGLISQYNPNATNSFIPGQGSIAYQFMENNTQSISWLIYFQGILNISTAYNGVIMNYTLTQINSQIMSAVYQNGILQISTAQFYYCFIYTIVNSTQNVQTVLQNIIIQQVRSFESPFILLSQNASIIRFGTILQTVAYNLVSILIEVQVFQSQYVLNDYRIDTQFFSFFNQFTFPITSLAQLGGPYSQNDYNLFSIVYANQIEAKTLQLRTQDLYYLDWQESCQFLMLNSSYKYYFQNLLSVSSSYYLAIMSIQTEKDNSIGILAIYDIVDQCFNNSIIYPFYYFNTTNMTLLTQFLVKFVGNQLVISQNGNTQIITFDSQIVIQYQTTQNATIAITAQNPISSYTNYINIQLDPSIIPTPPPTPPPTPITPQESKFKWYWILLVCLLALIFIILIIFLVTKFTKKSKNDKEGYKNFDEQGIEIKLAVKNSQL